MQRNFLSLLAATLRDPASLVNADRETLAWMVPRLLVVVVVGAAVFGGVVGSWRGGVQTAFVAAKMPVLLVVPMVVGLPAVRALFSTVDDDIPWSRLAAAGLVGSARSAILAAAFAPVVWLVWSVVFDYHVATLLFAVLVAGIGTQGLAVVRHVLPARRPAHLASLVVAMGVLGVATAQTGWVLRPFIARPTAEVAFLRPIEADIVSGLAVTTRSATGVYGEWDPESKGLLRGDERGSPVSQPPPTSPPAFDLDARTPTVPVGDPYAVPAASPLAPPVSEVP